ncbi:DUF7296 family protein [Streptomyces ardesiacus]|uniref:DUF7296 family protein n=1 Tax=Streptomyces ardesiacus TaxID=285564 RepID=UPI00382E08FC
MFFTFDQNNSGGGFDYDWVAGISHFVIIEADDVDHAIEKAEEIGLYFDGAGDCPCCGNRWSRPWDDDGSDEPLIYGGPVDQYLKTPYAMKWIDGSEAFIHYADGRIEGAIK